MRRKILNKIVCVGDCELNFMGKTISSKVKIDLMRRYNTDKIMVCTDIGIEREKWQTVVKGCATIYELYELADDKCRKVKQYQRMQY